MSANKGKGWYEMYGLWWRPTIHPVQREFTCIQEGGSWKTKSGIAAGNGLFYHYKAAILLIWPYIKWHRWLDVLLENYLNHRTVGIMGPASSGKTFFMALVALMEFYVFPWCTTVLCASTTKEMLENRIWGEIKKLHRTAQESVSWLPGHLIEGRQRLILDDREESTEGRDFRNGLLGCACREGNETRGLSSFAGHKNKRVRLFGDELSLLERVWVDSISNLDKNPDFKAVGAGNPKDVNDALGLLCEPAANLGGWDGGMDQGEGTKVWPTKRPNGVCIQLPGSDSPNLDGQLGIPLITQEQMDRDEAFYGRDSLWFTMMNLGRMPRGQGSRRILTRQMAQKFRAMDDPMWKDANRKRLGFLDAAFKGVGGDRCVFGEMQFGEEADPDPAGSLAARVVGLDPVPHRVILALIDVVLVPIQSGTDSDLPEDQIVKFVQGECEKRGIPPQNFFFDAGMRSSLVSAFARLWSPGVVPIDCGGTPTQRRVSANIDMACCDYYSKMITELWFSVRLIVEAGQFRGMTQGVLAEFCDREWTIVGKNKHEVEPKDAMKKKTGRSPDLADAVAIGCEGARRLGFVIRKLGNQVVRKHDDKWRTELLQKVDKLRRSHSLTYGVAA